MNVCSRYFLICLVAIAGCGTSESPDTEVASADSVRSQVIRGPVTLTVEITPKNVRLSDEPVLTVTIEYERGVVVTAPPFGEAVGEFLIRDFQEPVVPPVNSREVIRQIYRLEPPRAGSLSIAPIAVTFQDHRDSDDGSEYTVESEALSIEVTTLVGDAAPSLNDLKPSAPPVALPSSGLPVWVWVAFGLTAVAAGIGLWAVRQRRRQQSQKPALTPQQLAQLELDQIIGGRLAESDIKAFYTELTGVVRRYIERSTGVRAPEQTTEEFLHEILARAIFADDEQRRLRQFLESADLVKFAGHQPAADDIETSITRAREFTQLNSAASEEVSE